MQDSRIENYVKLYNHAKQFKIVKIVCHVYCHFEYFDINFIERNSENSESLHDIKNDE